VLVLEASPTTLCGHAALEDLVASVVAGLEDPIDPGFARSLLTDTSTEELAPDLQDPLVGELLKVPARVWKEMFAALLTYDDLAELGHITAPTLLVWGTTDALVGRDMQDLLVERIRGAELLTYPGVGHTPRWEAPTRFAHDVAEFVARRLRVDLDPQLQLSAVQRRQWRRRCPLTYSSSETRPRAVTSLIAARARVRRRYVGRARAQVRCQVR
jgi:hypothetical protein